MPGSASREYIYSRSQLLAKIEGGATQYYHADHLSVRVMTDSNGTKIGERGHYPFGDAQAWYETGTITKWKFTTYERDGESVNDYAMARSYTNRFGRFASPDPIAGSTTDPQSLNRYAYARNDAVNLVDPLGLTMIPYFCHPAFGDCTGGGGGGWGGGGGAWRPGILACGVDPFCIGRGGIGPFGSPVANGGSYLDSVYLVGGYYDTEENLKLKAKFEKCKKESGDWNIKHNLTLEGFLDAEAAAAGAGITTVEVLTTWYLEQSLDRSFGAIGKAGETGPMQVTTDAQTDLRGRGLLPEKFDTNPRANLLAGARWYAFNINVYGVPRNQAAAAYRKGHLGYKGKTGQERQKLFDERKKILSKFNECMRSGG